MEGSERVIGKMNLSATDIISSIILQAKYSTFRIHYGEEIVIAL